MVNPEGGGLQGGPGRYEALQGAIMAWNTHKHVPQCLHEGGCWGEGGGGNRWRGFRMLEGGGRLLMQKGPGRHKALQGVSTGGGGEVAVLEDDPPAGLGPRAPSEG